jgi:ribA/ribD-fused uncharacterized protein
MSAPIYHFFWVSKSPLSQWHPAKFTEGDVEYTSSEQYMMAEKARIMGDSETRTLILAATSAREIKALGRQVKNWDERKWTAERFAVVKRGNMLKFGQNPKMLRHLKRTRGEIVEASPYDAVWGIGLDEATAERTPQEKWPGENLLGKVLMEVRAEL